MSVFRGLSPLTVLGTSTDSFPDTSPVSLRFPVYPRTPYKEGGSGWSYPVSTPRGVVWPEENTGRREETEDLLELRPDLVFDSTW